MYFGDLQYLIESNYYNDELHPSFWSDGSFDSDVRGKLLDIVNDLFGKPEDVVEIDDIQLTGSLANFNYTEYSDLDVHILLDFKKINEDKALVKRALDGKRFVWNLRHNINIRGHEVELYYQDTNEPHVASGLYSLKNDEWITKPTYDPPSVDERDVLKKAAGIVDAVQRINAKVSGNISPEQAKKLHAYAKRVKEKLGVMRTEGLQRDGEFSIENLAFKELRNNGTIGGLINTISTAYSKIYSEGIDMPSIEDVFNTNNIDKPHVKDKFRSDGTPRARHMKGMTGIDRETGQNLIPDIHKVDHNSNTKVDSLLSKPAGRIVLDSNDIKDIVRIYRVTDLTPVEPKRLGNTGIVIYYDRNLQNYCIKK